jgi:tripartite-type tricarboxylate transporter receptor subunit TctC
MLNRRRLIGSLALAPFASRSIHRAAAANWPQRPVRILFPYASGGTSDAAARLVAERLSEVLGQAFVIETRPGANGVIATEAVARAPADGHTLLWAVTPQIAIAPATMKVHYDPVKDFAPISALCLSKFALVVNTNVPVRTVAEFVDYIRAQSKGFAYAEGSAGSISHLAMVLLLNRAGLTGTNVSYRGAGPAMSDVIAGHLPATFALFGDALSQAESGTVRLVAVASAQRAPQAPDVPTIAESGFPGFEAAGWWGLMAPAQTPQWIVDQLAAAAGHAVKEPKIMAQLANLAVDPLGTSPTEFATMISSDIQQWAKAVKIAGLAVTVNRSGGQNNQ